MTQMTEITAKMTEIMKITETIPIQEMEMTQILIQEMTQEETRTMKTEMKRMSMKMKIMIQMHHGSQNHILLMKLSGKYLKHKTD
jgi:hypothetical protein